MNVPDWRTLALNDGILPEPQLEDGRIVLWLPGHRDETVQHWERISNVVRAEIIVEQCIGSVPATAVRARQRLHGFVGKLFQRFHKATGDQGWILPNGDSAEQAGERQTDLLLVWGTAESPPLDETRIRSRWPQCKQTRQLGPNLFLVSGMDLPAATTGPEPLPAQGCPRAIAEKWLAAARQSGDRRREASALIDLGTLCTREGDAPRAVALLEEALTLARQLGDRSQESDARANLGLALTASNQPGRARELFEQALADARTAGDRFADKLARHGLGLAFMGLRAPARALAYFDQALTLARAIGDRKHEADLLWLLGIGYAELGRTGEASAHGQAAVQLLRTMGNPEAAWYAEHLHTYRLGGTGSGLGGSTDAQQPGPAGPFVTGSIVADGRPLPASAGATTKQPASGPGLLRIALTATKAMAQFVGSGFQTVPAATHQQRLRTCAACEHHTGLRCRLCGCFTNTKARLVHEQCPIGKWPA